MFKKKETKVHKYQIGDKVHIVGFGFMFPESYTITELCKRGRYRLDNGYKFNQNELFKPKTN